MLISKVVKINIGAFNLKFYLNKTKSNLNIGDILEIRIEDLDLTSTCKVDVKCDYCDDLLNIQYRRYIRGIKNIEKYSCSKGTCKASKNKDIFLKKYNVENIFQLESIKSKIKETNLEKYGVENPMLLEENKEKLKATNKERYGVEHALQSNENKEKLKETNKKRYGVEHASQSNSFKNRVKETNLEKYVEYGFQSNEVIEKSKETLVSLYDSDNIMKSDKFRKKFKIAQNNKYIKYLNDDISLFNCDCNKEHTFEISTVNYIHRINGKNPLCTICYPIDDLKSIKEKQLFEYIKSIYDGEIIQSYRDNLEIDIYLPELKIGFEFNGIYWHSNKYRDNYYHLDKTNYFKEKGIRIIHIWEDDFTYKKEIIESQIKNWLSKTDNKIYARNCYIKEISDSKEFLDINHIQGNVSSKLKLGLFYKDELVSIMTFDNFEGRKKMNDNEWNLSRFCNALNTNVIGSASKLLSYFILNYSPKRIISYADIDWSDGNLYETLGFVKVSETRPDYKYIIDDIRIHKSRFRKSNTGISESNLDIPKVYDCGKIKFELFP